MNSLGFTDYAIVGNGITIPFNTGTPDVNGCYWYLDGEIGGWDSPDGRVTMLTKIGTGPSSQGEYPADQHYRGRSLAFKLTCACPTEALRQEARYLIAQACDLIDSKGTFLVNEEIPKQVTVSRSGNNNQGKLVLTDSGLSTVGQITHGFVLPAPGDANNLIYPFTAEVELYCTDPYKYAQIPTVSTFVGNSAPLNNIGNAWTQNMVLTLNAGISGITGPLSLNLGTPDQVMQLIVPTLPAGAIPAGNFPPLLVIDFYNKIITGTDLGNYYYLRNLGTPWLSLQPGSANPMIIVGADVDGSTISYLSAWT